MARHRFGWLRLAGALFGFALLGAVWWACEDNSGAPGKFDAGVDGGGGDGGCPIGYRIGYVYPGSAMPMCVPIDMDLCAGQRCACRGVTLTGCDYVTEPFAYGGPCVDDGGVRDGAATD
jgi:hypothetical protein